MSLTIDDIRAAVREEIQDLTLRPCLTMEQAAKVLNETERNLLKRIARNEFPVSVCWNNGKAWRFNPGPLDKWRETRGLLGKRVA